MSAYLCRSLAAEYLRRTAEAADREKTTLRRVAIVWVDLADQAERRSGEKTNYQIACSS
jgi:hypothetical protein